MKKQFVLLGLYVLLFTMNAAAQSKIEYTYDYNGNRTSRKLTIVQLKSTDNNEEESYYRDEMPMNSSDEKTIKVFPNPLKNSLNIIIAGYDGDLKKEMAVYSLSGNKLKHKKIPGVAESIDLGDLENGIYLLQISVGDEIFRYKIVKSE